MAESLMVDRIQGSLGHELTPEDKYEVELWERGRTLAQVINTEAYKILVDTLKEYADKAVGALLQIPPGSESVPEAHAAAYALTDLCVKFQEDVRNAVNSSMTTPAVLKRVARTISPVPPESM